MSEPTSETAFSAVDQERQTRRLPVRLRREQLWGRAVGCCLVLGILLLAIAGGAAVLVRQFPAKQKDIWVAYAFVAAFGMAGLLLFGSGVHQWFASRVRETIVEIDLERIPLGSTVRVCFRQEGPITLNSLRANVRCVELRHRWKTRTSNSDDTELYRTTDEKDLWTENILDEEPGTVQTEEFWEKYVSFDVPDHHPVSLTTNDLEIVWKIEVWGQVQHWPDFMHPFVIQVV